MASTMVRAHCVLFLFLAFLGSTICCPGEECLRENIERSPQYDARDLPLSELSTDSLRQGELRGSYSVSGGRKYAFKDDAGCTATGWSELLLGFKPSSFYHRGALLDWIRNRFGKKQVEKQMPSKEQHWSKMLFVFGDSLFDAGNSIYISENSILGKYPYGFTYFSNATGRICDGRTVPDFIANYADLPLIPPALQPKADFSYGANFASVEAVVLDSDREINDTINFVEQVGLFKEMVVKLNATLGSTRTREILGQAVYLFSIGGNDYAYYFGEVYAEGRNLTQAEEEQFVKAVIGNTTEALIEIYELGGRKFGFQNVGPLGCLPLMESLYPEYNGTCIPMLLSLPRLHNSELYNALTSLAELLDGFKFSVMDYFHALYDRIEDPSKYGFNVGRFPCYNDDGLGNYTLCEYPSAYVFFNGGHTTQRANEQLSKLLWDGDPSVTRPYTVRQLFEED